MKSVSNKVMVAKKQKKQNTNSNKFSNVVYSSLVNITCFFKQYRKTDYQFFFT